MKIPCHNCICVAVCRHKAYRPMVEDCSLIREILYRDDGILIKSLTIRSDSFVEVAKEITDYMKPSWSLIPSGDSTYVIHNHDIKWMAKRRKV
jgi:hypothetical protein